MKRVVITEEEKLRILGLYSILTEQPDSKFDRQGIALTSKSDAEYLKRIREYDQMTKGIDPNDIESWVDNSVDLISAALEGIPGVGNLASAIVDVAHSLSYFIRVFTTSDDSKKFEYVINGITTGAMALLPLAGNIINIGLRATIKKFINMTHSDVIGWLSKYGIRLRTGIYLKSKSRFVYAWLAALKAYVRDEGIEFLTQVKDYSDKAIGFLESVKKLFNKIIYLPLVSTYNKAIDYVISLFKGLKTTTEEFEPNDEPPSWWVSGGEELEKTFYGNKEAIIIVGSYKDKDNFYKRGNELNDMGYVIHTSKTPDGNSRLGIIVKYNNETELNSALDKIKKEVQPNAWILK